MIQRSMSIREEWLWIQITKLMVDPLKGWISILPARAHPTGTRERPCSQTRHLLLHVWHQSGQTILQELEETRLEKSKWMCFLLKWLILTMCSRTGILKHHHKPICMRLMESYNSSISKIINLTMVIPIQVRWRFVPEMINQYSSFHMEEE